MAVIFLSFNETNTILFLSKNEPGRFHILSSSEFDAFFLKTATPPKYSQAGRQTLLLAIYHHRWSCLLVFRNSFYFLQQLHLSELCFTHENPNKYVTNSVMTQKQNKGLLSRAHTRRQLLEVL